MPFVFLILPEFWLTLQNIRHYMSRNNKTKNRNVLINCKEIWGFKVCYKSWNMMNATCRGTLMVYINPVKHWFPKNIYLILVDITIILVLSHYIYKNSIEHEPISLRGRNIALLETTHSFFEHCSHFELCTFKDSVHWLLLRQLFEIIYSK